MNAADAGAEIYLGDSVYAGIEHGMIKLMTHNGYPDDPRNVIYLEGDTLRNLMDWIKARSGS